MRNTTTDKKTKYLCDLFGVTDQRLLSVHNTAPEEFRKNQLSAMEGRMLQLLISLKNVKTVVEVGSCVGFSAICMAMALPSDGHLYTIEKEHRNVIAMQQNIVDCDVQDKVTIIHGNALEELGKLVDKGPFDMMFIDANKFSYYDYLSWAKKNVKAGGIIVADNVFLSNTVFEDSPTGNVSRSAHESMQNFNRELSNQDEYLSSILPTDEGMMVAIKLS